MAAEIVRIACGALRVRSNLRIFSKCRNCLLIQRHDGYSSSSEKQVKTSRDIGECFMQPQVQNVLKKLTGKDLDKIFRSRMGPLQDADYRLITATELEEMKKEYATKAEDMLQMHPIVSARAEINHILEKNAKLDQAIANPHVFVDISFGVHDSERMVVVRERDGTLRKAKWNERERVLQTYFPQQGRKVLLPKVFEEPNLQEALDLRNYEYVLDRACIQFEPDDPKFIEVTNRTYQHVSEKSEFERLYSTRYYGTMTFYHTWNKELDNLVLYYIENDRLDDLDSLLNLYCLVHPKSTFATGQKKMAANVVDRVEVFVRSESKQREKMERAVQALKQASQSREARN